MAHRVAGFACDFLACAFASIQLHDAANALGALVGGNHHLLVVSSTFGAGKLPRSARPLQQTLETGELDLSGIEYGIICLGDRSFQATFCGAGREWNKLLGERGGHLRGPILNLDMCLSQIDVPAIHRWTRAWIASMNTM